MGVHRRGQGLVNWGGVRGGADKVGRWGERVHQFKKVMATVRAKGRKGGGERSQDEDTHVTFMAPVSQVAGDGGIVGASGSGAVGGGGGWGY